MCHLKCEAIFFCLAFSFLFLGIRSDDISECSAITCFNNGTMVTIDRNCICQCQPEFSGLLCEYEVMSSVWPSGPYALLMSSTGCPESEAHGWGSGYINFTTVNRMEIWEEFENVAGVSQVSDHNATIMYGLFSNFSLQINFCFKHAHALSNNISEWPLSPIDVFGVEVGCPTGLVEEAIDILLPNTSSWRTDGYLPYFNVRNTENGTTVVMKNCRYEELSEFPVEQKVDHFILLQYQHRNCSTDWLRFTTERYKVAICDANINSTDIKQCPTLRFCAYSPGPEFNKQGEAISRWPNVPFAMLYPRTGCPNFADFKFGVILFKTSALVTIEFDGYRRSYNETFHIFLCSKNEMEKADETLSWPRGEYSILRVKDECPEGFRSESITVPLPSIKDWYGFGELPQFEVNLNQSEIVFEACRHKRGHNDLVPFPSYGTYWSLQMTGSQCGTSPEDEIQLSQRNFSIVTTTDLSSFRSKSYESYVCEYQPNKISGCFEDQFHCDAKVCIDLAYVCDGETDCFGERDENPANCATVCDFPELHCDTRRCIPRIWLCDGFQHCFDGQDELESNCYGNNVTDGRCLDREIKCDGKCLPVSWVCDGTKDCSDGSDEDLDNCQLKCEKYQVSCDYGKCLSRHRVCDNWPDCFDETDERDCQLVCLPDEFNCGIYLAHSNKRCIKKSKVCDSYVDCPNHRDEDTEYCSSLTKTFCESKLGMTDGYINDYQMSASSWIESHKPEMARPFQSSWCPEVSDKNPFLQIDLIFVSLVRGLILFNDAIVTSNENVHNNVPKLELLGCRSFHVFYSIFQDSFKQYDAKPFEVDSSQNLEIPQQFMFLRPYLARFVRVHPLSPIDDGQLCVQLELIGCATINESQSHAIQQPEKANEVNIKVHKYSTITSKGYPLEYPSNTVFKWNVTTDANGYLRFTFAVIDLHDTTIIPSVECSEDMVILSRDTVPITSDHNGLTPTFPTSKRRALITFRTCERTYGYNDRRKGFELIIKKEDVPTLGLGEVIVNMKEGNLVSYSFLGLATIPAVQKFDLQSSLNGGPYILSFEYFHFPVNTGNILSMKTGIRAEFENYHNENRPKSTFEDWNIQIIAYVDENVKLPFVNGFSATFRTDVAPKYNQLDLLEFKETSINSTLRHVADRHKVCLKILKKCYVMWPGYTFVNWLKQFEYCHSIRGDSLISIHSRKEQRFLHSWLWYKLRDFGFHGRDRNVFGRRPKYPFYINIGLIHVQYTDDTGLGEIWTDGSKVSFTNWDKDEPKNPKQYQCTGLRIGRTIEETKWVTIDCHVRYTSYTFGITCQTPYQTSVAEDQDVVLNQPEDVESATTDTQLLAAVLYRCASTEFVSQLAVCDGVPDCTDGSDENKCVPKHLAVSESNSEACNNGFTCRNGECLPFAKVCNYVADCLDGSDEICRYPDCDKSEFRCSNGQCIPSYLKCNIVEDCLDGSDEVQCVTCNASVAFACDDLTCIPKSFVCNNIQDCAHGKDETNCTLTFSTCYDYWKTGYEDKDFSILIPEHGVAKCRFQKESANIVTVWTIFDLVYNIQLTSRGQILQYSIFIKDASNHGDFCTYAIIDTCERSMVELYEYYHLPANSNYSGCNTSWHKKTFGLMKNESTFFFQSYIEIGGLQVYPTRYWAWPENSVNKLQSSQLYHAVGVRNIRPIECAKEYSAPPDVIRCGDGTHVPMSHRCLYNINSAGVIDGCPNFKHLEDCETFSCPLNYVKCPSSFCVSHRLLCDGEKNCPGGEDENGCGCEQRNATLVFIYDGNMGRDRQFSLFKLARRFYSANVKLIAISYSLDSINTGESYYTITKKDIHPYNEALQLIEDEKETFKTHCCLADSILNFINDHLAVVVFNIDDERPAIHQLSKIVTNNSSVIDLYKVRVDPGIQQRVVVTSSSRETEVIFKSWEIIRHVNPNVFPGICLDTTASNCAGKYRCSSSRICIPLNHICDRERQCPFGDDEAVCRFQCPKKCLCKLYVVECRLSNFTDFDLLTLATSVRVLDISQNVLFMDHVFTLQKTFPFLLELNTSRCNIRLITQKTFNKTPSLIHLDLSFNQISRIQTDTFSDLVNLNSMDLNGNYQLESIEPHAFKMLSKLSSLSITKTKLFEIQSNTFSGLVLKTLDIANNQIHTLHGRAFNNLSVEEIWFDGNDVSNNDDQIFTGIRNVKTIRASAFKFCCNKPSSVSDDDCFPQKDEFSSCDDLMRNSMLQTLIWLIGAMALVGNISVFIYRLVNYKANTKSGYGVFVTHLAASDFLMGLYMLTIAIADLTFRKRYIEVDDYWRHSIWCQTAGVLATVSSETSILLIVLITVHRFMVIKFPFGQWRFGTLSIRLSVLVSWSIAWTLAVVPLVVNSYFNGEFYSQSGLCLALPLSRNRRPGWLYSFLIHIALNFVAFILIAIGQLAIYLEVKKSSRRMQHIRSQRRNDIGIAKNLLFVVATDFMCWFPIGIMAILAYEGYEIPRDIHAWTAVIILPINSALNPLLYTLPALLRRKAEERKMTEMKLQKIGSSLRTRSVEQHIRSTPRETFTIALAIARHLQKLHLRNLVYGDNILIETSEGKLQAYPPLPKRARDPTRDKKIDVHKLGMFIEKLLKID